MCTVVPHIRNGGVRHHADIAHQEEYMHSSRGAGRPMLVAVDSRKRVSLGALARYGVLHEHYLASVRSDGSIWLEPAVVMPLERSRELCAAEKNLRAVQSRLDDEPPF